jgi:hypothetical protein
MRLIDWNLDNLGNQDRSLASAAVLPASKLDSSTATVIHDADHEVVTTVPVLTVVHDLATVTGSGPTPTGTVTFS